MTINRDALWEAIKLQESMGRQFGPDGKPLTSKSGAVGVAQVMPGIAQSMAEKYGLEWNQERFYNDAAYNESIGKAFFNDLVDKYGDTSKVLAAYNRGETNLNASLKKHGDNWQSAQPAETQDYIKRISANYGAATTDVLAGSYAEATKAISTNDIAGPPAPQAEPIAQAPSQPVVQSTPGSRVFGGAEPQQPTLSGNAPLPTGPGGVPLVNPQTDINAESVGQLGAGIRPSSWQKFWSQAELNLLDAPFGLTNEGAIPRAIQQSIAGADAGASGSLKISAEEANRLHPGLPEPFNEPVYPEVAKLVSDANDRRQRLQSWVNRGPETGTLFGLAAGLPVGLDPLNLALASALGGASSALGLVKNIRTLRGLGLVFGENLAANILGEVPSHLQRPRENQPNPPILESGIGAVVGAVMGTGIHAGLELTFTRAEMSAKETPKPVLKQNLETAAKLHESGAKIDMTPAVVVQTARELGHVAPGIENPYIFQKLTHPSDVHYYVPIDPETGHFTINETEGGAIAGVDNRAVANNIAGIPESDGNGRVIRAELSKDANLADGAASIRSLFPEGITRNEALDKIKNIIGADERRWSNYADDLKKLWKGQASIGDLFDYFKNAPLSRITPFNDIPLNEFKALIDGLGYDGLRYFGTNGAEAIDNRVLVFNHDKLTPVEVTAADKAAVPQMTEAEAVALSESAHAPENQRFHDPELKKQVETPPPLPKEMDIPQLDDAIVQAEQNALADLKERAKESPELAKEITLIYESHAIEQYGIEAVKNFAKCLSGNTV